MADWGNVPNWSAQSRTADEIRQGVASHEATLRAAEQRKQLAAQRQFELEHAVEIEAARIQGYRDNFVWYLTSKHGLNEYVEGGDAIMVVFAQYLAAAHPGEINVANNGIYHYARDWKPPGKRSDKFFSEWVDLCGNGPKGVNPDLPENIQATILAWEGIFNALLDAALAYEQAVKAAKAMFDAALEAAITK